MRKCELHLLFMERLESLFCNKNAHVGPGPSFGKAPCFVEYPSFSKCQTCHDQKHVFYALRAGCKRPQLCGIFMLHMATSYLSAGYQELRNLCGTSKVALQQGVIASTIQTIYGMFTEGSGINKLQKKRCLVLRLWASCCKANHPAWKAACHILLIRCSLRVPVKPLENRNRLCCKQWLTMWRISPPSSTCQHSLSPCCSSSLATFRGWDCSQGNSAEGIKACTWAHATQSAASAKGWWARTSAPSIS